MLVNGRICECGLEVHGDCSAIGGRIFSSLLMSSFSIPLYTQHINSVRCPVG